MPKLAHVEARISMIEKFEIVFMKNGQDAKGNIKDIPSWPCQRRSKNDMTVGEWKQKFSQIYPGYDVEVLKGNEEPAVGQMKLGTVRDTYLD